MATWPTPVTYKACCERAVLDTQIACRHAPSGLADANANTLQAAYVMADSDFEQRFAAQMEQARKGEGLVGQVTSAHLAKVADAKAEAQAKMADRPSFEEALSADIEAMRVAGHATDITGMEKMAFEAVRSRMDTAERLQKAEDCRVEANANFKSKKWLSSMVGYLGGIWFLQRGEPPCPRMVACEAEDYAEVPAALGAGEPLPGKSESPLTREQESERERLRLSLHLNIAAAALKLSQWVIARTACQYCLMVEGENASPKARRDFECARPFIWPAGRRPRRHPTPTVARLPHAAGALPPRQGVRGRRRPQGGGCGAGAARHKGPRECGGAAAARVGARAAGQHFGHK